MEKKLYLVSNCGCDDTTRAFFELTDEEFNYLKNFFDKLNKNSSYGCQPTVYITECEIEKEMTEEEQEENDWWDYDEHFNGKYYKFKR